MLDVFWQVVNVTTWIHHWNPLCYICTPPVSKTRTHQIWPSQLFSLSTVIGPFLWQLSHSKQHGYIIGIPFLRFKLKHPRKNTFKNAHFDQVLLLRTRSDLETTIRWQLCSPLLHRDWSNLLNLANAYVPEDRISYRNKATTLHFLTWATVCLCSWRDDMESVYARASALRVPMVLRVISRAVSTWRHYACKWKRHRKA